MTYLPKKPHLSSTLVVSLAFALLLAVAPTAALAAPPAPEADQAGAQLTEEEIRSQFGLSEDVVVVTQDEMTRIVDLCLEFADHFYLEDDGTIGIDLEDPGDVGVSPTFYRNFQYGLGRVNLLIRNGWFTVDDDFYLQPTDRFGSVYSAKGLAGIEKQLVGESPDYYYGGTFFNYDSSVLDVPHGLGSLAPTFNAHFLSGRHSARTHLLFGHDDFFNTRFHGGAFGFVPRRSLHRNIGDHPFYYRGFNDWSWRVRYLTY